MQSKSTLSQIVLWNVHWRKCQTLVYTHLHKQFNVGVYYFFADPKTCQHNLCVLQRRVFLFVIRVMLGLVYSDYEFVGDQTAQANDY